MFTSDQIAEIEDKVVNKIIYPMVALSKTYKSGTITDKQIVMSLENLTELYNWVYSLRR